MTEELKTFIGEKMGEVTMCWKPIPKGVFDSQRAAKILDEVYAAIEKEYENPSPIKPVPPSRNPGTKVGRWPKRKWWQL